ncbi:hypothetical protein B0T22DRAFT_439081 [Podospora appendiculata]|uniref:Uncharacterized protein n=1 Tax=Podospora appendiculata TaxID=314037 RepID=A0AAE1CBF1_9PEZI|nr:hypothetical protein B0T22DRAFT_439081 [Podospora appendiculata]
MPDDASRSMGRRLMVHGTLVPPWYQQHLLLQSDLLLATFLWGCTIAVSLFAGAKGVRQTYRSWTRSHRVNAYIVMIWLEWWSCLATSIIIWFFLEEDIPPSLWYFTGLLVMWTIQSQCLMQIMTNRISLVMYNPDKARTLRLAVGLAIGVVNVSVFCIWIPARLQISPRWIQVNNVWDRVEKSIFLVIDASLNWYFMWLIKSKLVANGLIKYRLVYRFNLLMVCLSISLDILIIGLMSLPDDTVYIQVHPLAYMIKLHIEMNIAELLGKVLMKSNRRRNSFSTCGSSGWWRPDDSTSEVFNREWRGLPKRCTQLIMPSGGQMHELNTDILRSDYGSTSNSNSNKNNCPHSCCGCIYGTDLPGAEKEEDDRDGDRNMVELARPQEVYRQGSSAWNSLHPSIPMDAQRKGSACGSPRRREWGRMRV